MGRQKRPGNSGAARAFITRRKAIEKLALSLKDFRRLCIMKGVYPVDPKNKSKVGSGGANKTYYLLSDIQYLSHEPIIWKFWDFKIFMKRIKRAHGRKDYDQLKHVKENRPFYKLDHIVKERYPSFVDALRDLDDCLSMCCLYSRFPKLSYLPQELIQLSRRLSVEFMCFIVESRALRKVFISIKGYYYQAEVMGQAITWVVPHDFVIQKVPDVDYRVMKTFTEFYVTLMGFINFKLFSSLNLSYPPKVASVLNTDQADLLAGFDEHDLVNEQVAALNRPLVKTQLDNVDPEAKVDYFEDILEKGEEETKSCVGLTFVQTTKLQKLFEGLKFYINREVPRESLVFVIRSFGGEVSYDKVLFIGATYDESDQKITHQIVDREVIANKYMNRFYVQPQWVFDCINARTILPVQEYFPGVALPPHLSPFVQEVEGEYVSPDTQRLRDLQSGTQVELEEEEADEEESNDEEVVVEKKPVAKKRSKKEKQADDEENKKKLKTEVKPGKAVRENTAKKTTDLAAEEKRLAVMMISKKKKRLYDKIMYGKKRQVREAENLSKKRAAFDKSAKQVKKGQ